MKAWAGREDNSEAEIKICVANKIDKLVENGAVKRPSWLLSACNWCNSELYEYIEVTMITYLLWPNPDPVFSAQVLISTCCFVGCFDCS